MTAAVTTLRKTLRSSAALVALFLMVPALAHAQRARDTTISVIHPIRAAAEVLFINVAVNRTDAWVFGQDWAHVRPKDWSEHFRLGWDWDEDHFGTNMFSHPYHGALYFNSARSQGLTYFQSAPYAFLGSWNWEYFGERFRPSLNDFFMTSIGGIALGEVFHRLGASIRNNRATGKGRALRELAALPFDPVGGLTRIVNGKARAIAVNPPEHRPEAYVLRVNVGARISSDSGLVNPHDSTRVGLTPSIQAELQYGDPFRTHYLEPFDVFSIRTQINGTSLNVLRASGRLYARDLNRPTARNRHVFGVNQRYDFANNSAYKFGGQSVEAGLYSRWRLGIQSAIRTELFVDGIMMGGIDAPFSGLGKRTYDFGPGVGVRTEYAYERRGVTYVTIWARTEYVHSVSGASADHNALFGGTEITIPFPHGVGLGLHTGYYKRTSRYSDRPDDTRGFPEVRLFLSWTAGKYPGVSR